MMLVGGRQLSLGAAGACRAPQCCKAPRFAPSPPCSRRRRQRLATTASSGNEGSSDGSARELAQDNTRAQWSATTSRLVSLASVPFSILVLPQVIINCVNIASGNAVALSVISWQVCVRRGEPAAWFEPQLAHVLRPAACDCRQRARELLQCERGICTSMPWYASAEPCCTCLLLLGVETESAEMGGAGKRLCNQATFLRGSS